MYNCSRFFIGRFHFSKQRNANSQCCEIPSYPRQNGSHQGNKGQSVLLRTQERWTLRPCWWEHHLKPSLWKPKWTAPKRRKPELASMSRPSYPTPTGAPLCTPQGYLPIHVSPILLTRAKKGSQSGCPGTDEWTGKRWGICTKELYSAVKKDETVTVSGNWMKLQAILLSEISQIHK